MKNGARFYIPSIILFLNFLLLIASSSLAGSYTFTVKESRTCLNDKPILVVGLRCSNALLSNNSTESLIARLDEFKSYGVNTVSVYFMGSRFGDVKGYNRDGSLNPVYTARMGRIIEAADARGMIVLVGCLYWGNSKAKWESWTQQEANTAVTNTVAWLKKHNYRNVFVDVDNEGMALREKQFDNREIVLAVKNTDPACVIATNFRGDPPPEADLGIHFSTIVPDKPYIESEGTPKNVPGGYWGKYSKNPDIYNYINIGIYSSEMKKNQIAITREHLSNGKGYMCASTWLQCAPPYGPNADPGGDGSLAHPGIRWWLEAVRELVGPYTPPAPRVGLWDVFEEHITNNGSYQNPFTDVELRVTYTRPDGQYVSFWGFYDGGNMWKIRFMPDQVGEWRYRAAFSDGSFMISGAFTCVHSDIPGMISIDETNPVWFGYKGGKYILIRSLHVGDRFFADLPNVVTGEDWDSEKREIFLDWAQQQGYNTLSVASHYLNRDVENRGRGWNTPDLWDEAAARPNSNEYQRMEAVLNELTTRKMLVFPFAGFFGKSADWPTELSLQDFYIRYTLARLGPYWNLLFNVSGPEPLLQNHEDQYKNAMTFECINQLGRLISGLDIFLHPLSLHNPTKAWETGDPFKNQDWYTFTTLQGPKTIDRLQLYEGLLRNHHNAKPLYAQETLWSGNKYHPDYTDEDLRKNAIVIMMAAAALNFADNDGTSSSGFSGTLELGQRHQDRHDIIKNVWDFFEGIPFYELKPRPDLVNAGFCLADPGQIYLVYLPEPEKLRVDVGKGSYKVDWINAADTSERFAGSISPDGLISGLPKTIGDWLVYVTREQ
ncbi:DUF5060 domain-containing protein [candidate division KSB1 bacterium]|nr:DUF5060 domain-containing protein [candidate division KSB1 bacterium]